MTLRVAIVDDDQALVRVISNLFSDREWEVMLCPDGGEALPFLAEMQPDLILLNLWLETSTNGWMLLRLLTGDSTTCRIPVIVYCGGSSDVGDKDAWMGEHEIIVLPKPLAVGDISQRLEGILHCRAVSPAGTTISTRWEADLVGHQEPRVRKREDLHIRLLGGFHVSVGSRVIEEREWSLHKAKSLVKILALAPQHRMHRERFMDILWPNLGSVAATNNLHRTLHVARHVLEPALPFKAPSSYLHLRGALLSLDQPGQLEIDVDAFQIAARDARRSRNPIAYEDALRLYAGDLLPEDRFEEWCESERSTLAELRCALLMELAFQWSQSGKIGPAADALQQVVESNPLHEEARAEFMRLLARAGHRDQALRQYQHLRDSLKRELDVAPVHEIQALEQHIRSGN